jgi:hypothetical protein
LGPLQLAEASRREIPGDTMDGGAVRPVRRKVDLDHGIKIPEPIHVDRAHRGLSRQIDDAIVIFRQL